MGIFTDRCDALIDPNTQRALSGDALEAAKLDPKWPRCGNRVRKNARFCNRCGSPAPGGWWRCPSCGKWIGNDSRFCPHCNTPLYPDDRSAMAGGVWRKEPGMFAQRFEIGDVKRILQDGLQIQEGTLAIIMDGGEVRGILESGRHAPDSLAHKINWFGNPPPRSVVLVDAAEVAFPVHIEALSTAERYPIEFYGEVILRFRGDKDSARALVANLMKSDRSTSLAEISARLESVMRFAVDSMCTATTLDDLVRDPQRRIRLQESMTRLVADDLAASGLEVARVSSAEFTGDEYEKLAATIEQNVTAHAGDSVEDNETQYGYGRTLDQQRRYEEYRDALRKTVDHGNMSQYKDADDMRRYILDLNNEYGLTVEEINHEWEVLKRERSHEAEVYQRMLDIERLGHADELRHHAYTVEDEDQAHQFGLGDRAVDNSIANAGKIGDFNRGEALKNSTNATQISGMSADEQVRQAKEWIGVRREKNQVNLDYRQAEADRRHGMSLEERLMDVDDDALRARLLQKAKLDRDAALDVEHILAEAAANNADPIAAGALTALRASDNSRTPEQILAALAAQSPAAAVALERLKQVELDKTREDAERFVKKVEDLHDDSYDREDSRMGTLLSPINEAAKKAIQPLPPPQQFNNIK